MRIAIIDADLVGRKKHRFPNLVCMKISGYHKECGDEVILKTDYDGLHEYDKVFLSKVFTDTEVPNSINSGTKGLMSPQECIRALTPWSWAHFTARAIRGLSISRKVFREKNWLCL